MKKILLISHDASRTGAPILLLNLAQVLQSDSYHVSFLLKRGDGDMLDDYSSMARLTIAHNKPLLNDRISMALGRRFKMSVFSKRSVMAAVDGVDIVLSNTITNGDILPFVRKYFKGPIISYIHEMKMAADYFTTPANIQNLLNCTDHFFTPSQAVQEYLTHQWHITPSRIDRLPYYIPKISEEPPLREKSSRIKPQLVVGGAGTTDWRKAPELFIALAAITTYLEPTSDIVFYWKGAFRDSLELKRLQYDVDKAHLTDKVIFLPASGEVSSFYETIDLFVLTSREDPYPLVVLEAASASVPAICFKGAGGAEEFIEDDAGAICPYLDLLGVAKKILHYYNHKTELENAGEIALRKLSERHQQPEVIRQKLDTVITKLTLHENS